MVVSLAWLLLVSLAYVYTHKAISPEMLLAVSKKRLGFGVWQSFCWGFAAAWGVKF
jgi:hypothetical protein